MISHSGINVDMSHRDKYARCRSSTQSVDRIGVTGLVAVGLIRQNLVQKVERMRPELSKRQSVLEPESKPETRPPYPNHQHLDLSRDLKFQQPLSAGNVGYPRWPPNGLSGGFLPPK